MVSHPSPILRAISAVALAPSLMAEVYVLDPSPPRALGDIAAHRVHNVASLADLLVLLFQKGNCEKDTNHATVVVLLALPLGPTPLDRVSNEDAALVLRYFFNHLNVLVLEPSEVNSDKVAQINATVATINALISKRISRVATWTGTGDNINDFFSHTLGSNADIQSLSLDVAEIVSTMLFVVDHNANKSPAIETRIRGLNAVILESVNFKSLLADSSDENLARLCHCVGHWSFPAHELTNDDLVYCVFLILSYALANIQPHDVPEDFAFPSENQLLAFVFMVRDTYKNGNPFHNFRHAVDVLQACFHYLVRLQCLPQFEQFEEDPRADELAIFSGEKTLSANTQLVAVMTPLFTTNTSTVPHLNGIQALGLLIAALGHDVGHPGVTNAFLIKHYAPTSQLYSERSVLELYHSSVFINKILRINWPSLLELETDPESKLPLKNLIIGSILATDMAEHFEYLHKLKEFELQSNLLGIKVRLIASLLIKCADISNVTRPLRVSSQWALVLSREFEEVETLDTKLTKHANVNLDVDYPKLATTLDEVLQVNPDLHKGQIFFIQTFAEGLFNSILELLPELKYTSDIVKDNKSFWLARAKA